MKNIAILLMTILGYSGWSQDCFWIYLVDKGQAPQEGHVAYLSRESMERRSDLGIETEYSDIPIHQQYVRSLQEDGLVILGRSRWLNAVAARLTEEEQERVLQHNFVSKVVRIHSGMSDQLHRGTFEKAEFSKVSASAQNQYDYGNGKDQIKMLKGDFLHGLGFTGGGMKIAVFDGGFTGVDSYSAFEDLRQEGRIKAKWDFIDKDSTVFHGSLHGTGVLSVMASNLDGVLVGTAPDADYYLARTENVGSETPVEEVAWIMAAEWADSIGVDVINSSLGYNLFDDPKDNYSYSDMDGRTATVSLGAQMAARKGILVVSSAGNEGNAPWTYITAPGDADSILTVGAVDMTGDRASFSGVGPTFDGRIKPNVSALGVSVSLVGFGGTVGTSNGTSFSSPLVCGLAACLMQAHPEKDPQDVIQAIQASSSQSNQPDSLLGYGIPDFSIANVVLSITDNDEEVQTWTLGIDRISNSFFIEMPLSIQGTVHLDLVDMGGRSVSKTEVSGSEGIIHWTPQAALTPGVYALRLRSGNSIRVFKVIL